MLEFIVLNTIEGRFVMATPDIPKATVKRLPIYYRYLNMLANSGIEHVSSTQLAEAVKIDSATIRRDLSYFGALGKRGYGYDVKSLCTFFKKILDQDNLNNVALVGVGNLGHALLNYNFHKNNNMRISVAFDTDPKITGLIQSGIPVYPLEDMEEQLRLQRIEIAILTVPEASAQEVTDKLVAAGIKGILNFTPLRISVKEGVLVQNVDLTNELQTLIYFLKQVK